MKAYIASRFSNKEFLNAEIVPALEFRGVEVTSRWLSPDGPEQYASREHMGQVADINREDIEICDMLVFHDAGPSPSRGGCHWEIGFAYALHKLIYMIGDTDNAMAHQPGVQHFGTWEKFYSYLEDNHDSLSRLMDMRRMACSL